MVNVEEKAHREDNSIRFESTVGAREAVLLENIGGIILFSVAGRVAVGEDQSEEPRASTAIDRDTWKYDIADWITQQTATGVALDATSVVEEAVRVNGLLDTYRWGKAEVEDLEDDKKRWTSPRVQRAQSVDKIAAFMQEAIDQYGEEAIKTDPALRDEIISQAEALQSMTAEEIAARVAELSESITTKADALEAETGAQLKSFEQSGQEAVSKLLVPMRSLIGLEIIEAQGSFDGLIDTVVQFGPYGSIPKKMTVSVPAKLNAAQIPMTYADANKFAERARAEAGKSTSIWGRL